MNYQDRACTLFSGSAGNSVFVQNKDSSILIDAGVSCKRLLSAMSKMEISPEKLNGILITHEHSDHIAGLSVFARRFQIPTYMSLGTWNRIKHREQFRSLPDVRIVHENLGFEVGSMAIKPFSVPHDAGGPLGYRIDTGKAVVALASDVGEYTDQIAEHLSCVDLAFIEANYDAHMLWGGSYPWPLKQRIVSGTGHISNVECAYATQDMLESGSTRFVLIHLSENNNTPELAYSSVETHLNKQGAKIGIDYLMTTAPRYTPSVWQYL